jgi:hypothetical protein
VRLGTAPRRNLAAMKVDELVSRFPVVYHTTAGGRWTTIRDHGLWTAEQIVRTAWCDRQSANLILTTRRTHAVQLTHPVLGAVTIRDQAPLRPEVLKSCLTDMSVAEWLSLLNHRVFFWLHPSRVSTLLSGRRNRDVEHDVIVVGTASLVEAHHERISLSPINSGATLYPNAAPRGSQTFHTIADYPYAQRRQTRAVSASIVELAVADGVRDIAAHTIGVQRWKGPNRLYDIDP